MADPVPPRIDFGGRGPALLFASANGFPPGTYRALLERLGRAGRVTAVLHRPLWTPPGDPAGLRSWTVFGEDLARLAASLPGPVTGVGHSMGATALALAALARPELFSRIALVEPVLMPLSYHFALRLFGPRIPLIRRTLARRTHWPDRRAAFAHFRAKKVFAGLGDEVLGDYVDSGLADDGRGGLTLAWSREWEARCYARAYRLLPELPRLETPALGARGARSDTVSPRAWARWRRSCPGHAFAAVEDAGHLLPLERPERLAEIILDWAGS